MNYSEALKTGKVVVTSIAINEDKPTQVGVVFAQNVTKPAEVRGEASSDYNPLIALSQGLDYGDGSTTITAIMYFAIEVAKKFFGTTNANYNNHTNKAGLVGEDKGIFADDIYGVETAICVVENTIKNPKSPKQTPVSSPAKGVEGTKDYKPSVVKTFEGKPVFRHTELKPAAQLTHKWLKYDTKTVTTDSKLKATIAAIEDLKEVSKSVFESQEAPF